MVSDDGLTVSGQTAVLAGGPPPDAVGFGAPSDLYRINIDTGEVEQLTDTPNRDERTPEFVGSNRVFYVVSRGNDKDGSGRILDLRTGRQRAVTPQNQGIVDATAAAAPNLAIYTVVPGGDLLTNQPCFFSVSLSGGPPRKLFCLAARYPDLAPNGKWLVAKELLSLEDFVAQKPTDPRETPADGPLIRVELRTP